MTIHQGPKMCNHMLSLRLYPCPCEGFDEQILTLQPALEQTDYPE